jgi:PPOX class probable F420-dependent enzyme
MLAAHLPMEGRLQSEEGRSVPEQGDLSLLDDPVAQELLNSTHLARLAYVWPDGTPRVVPVWFHWDGRELVIAGPPDAPKMSALPRNGNVAITIDGETWPYHALLIRGTASTSVAPGVPSEYAAAAERYMGEEGGKNWVANIKKMSSETARIAVRPQWVAILDFETRWPSAIEKRMAAAGAAGG